MSRSCGRRGSQLQSVRKVCSVLLILLLIPLIWAQIAAQTARELLFDPAFTKSVVHQSGLYLQLEQRLVDELAANFTGPQIPVEFTTDEIRTLVNRVLPASRLQVLAEASIDGLHAWFISGTVRPNMVVDLTDVQLALPPALRQLLESKVAALPVCTASQALELVRTYNGGMPPCRSGNASFDRMVIDRAMRSSEVERLIPPRFDLAVEMELRYGEDFWTQKSRWFGTARLGVLATKLGWYVIAALVVALAMLNREQWHTPFAWVATPLLIAGATTLTVGWIGAGVLLPFVDTLTAPTQPSGAVVYSLVKMAMESLTVAMKDLGLLISLSGLACLVIAMAGSRTSGGPATIPKA